MNIFLHGLQGCPISWPDKTRQQPVRGIIRRLCLLLCLPMLLLSSGCVADRASDFPDIPAATTVETSDSGPASPDTINHAYLPSESGRPVQISIAAPYDESTLNSLRLLFLAKKTGQLITHEDTIVVEQLDPAELEAFDQPLELNLIPVPISTGATAEQIAAWRASAQMPDLVYSGASGSNPGSGDWMDLMPYLAQDASIRADRLFTSMLVPLQNDDKIYGIPFLAATSLLMMDPEVLQSAQIVWTEPYTARPSWTLFRDMAEQWRQALTFSDGLVTEPIWSQGNWSADDIQSRLQSTVYFFSDFSELAAAYGLDYTYDVPIPDETTATDPVGSQETQTSSGAASATSGAASATPSGTTQSETQESTQENHQSEQSESGHSIDLAELADDLNQMTGAGLTVKHLPADLQQLIPNEQQLIQTGRLAFWLADSTLAGQWLSLPGRSIVACLLPAWSKTDSHTSQTGHSSVSPAAIRIYSDVDNQVLLSASPLEISLRAWFVAPDTTQPALAADLAVFLSLDADALVMMNRLAPLDGYVPVTRNEDVWQLIVSGQQAGSTLMQMYDWMPLAVMKSGS